jgi:hypothetical protein
MAGMANGSAELVMRDRTRGQHAVPVTFGFVVAAWIDELLRPRRTAPQGRAAGVHGHARLPSCYESAALPRELPAPALNASISQLGTACTGTADGGGATR